MDDKRRYGIKVINEKAGRELMLNLQPMTHAQACTFKSKMTNYAWRRVELVQL